jgi:hypothetical protein
MLSPSEIRKYHAQVRRKQILDAKIEAMEKARPFDHLSIVEQAEAEQILQQLIEERDELFSKFPKATVEALFARDPTPYLFYA